MGLSLIHGEALVFRSSSFSKRSFSIKSWRFDGVVPLIASLGGNPYEQKNPKVIAIDDDVEEALSASTVSRIRNEFLSEALANDLINRAKVRKARAEEEALLLMI